MSMLQPNAGAVSGPGKLSKRTDLPPSQGAKRLPDAAYGEQRDFQAQQAGAPMAKSSNPMAGVIPLGAPTNRPSEPVTAGIDAGPGPGSEILGLKGAAETMQEDLSVLAKYMPLMAAYADTTESTGTMKAFVRYLRGNAQ
jgi:hypothetical protein